MLAYQCWCWCWCSRAALLARARARYPALVRNGPPADSRERARAHLAYHQLPPTAHRLPPTAYRPPTLLLRLYFGLASPALSTPQPAEFIKPPDVLRPISSPSLSCLTFASLESVQFCSETPLSPSPSLPLVRLDVSSSCVLLAHPLPAGAPRHVHSYPRSTLATSSLTDAYVRPPRPARRLLFAPRHEHAQSVWHAGSQPTLPSSSSAAR
ncbi:hypothetical protein F4780DRAFT_102921 [Xylariomycetidae sp. FL0641]|nr:hypothetical protein F4780DRAFT_102921 [Xylariomycetidae sp. FL0641]